MYYGDVQLEDIQPTQQVIVRRQSKPWMQHQETPNPNPEWTATEGN